MIEAEYKVRLADPAAVRKQLAVRSEPDYVVYSDTYVDTADRALAAADQEFRLRTIDGASGTTHLLTFKDAAVDDATGSKPEYETVVGDREAMNRIVSMLGYRPVISFTKRCENYRFQAARRQMLATIVTVPEIDGTFLELETSAADTESLPDALQDLRLVLDELGITADQYTTELYTDAVARSRQV
ncbi:class IV adenylate cyclase [Nocardia mexicana]|uniref:class IV adenylate cyclase n=1 Tax=Nocardia mexicana TaxID=279262 RepID=UPI0009FF744F|nr:class IV adenylate cyclase [Nocardia mexicana]